MAQTEPNVPHPGTLFISCAQRKREGRHPAIDLYIGRQYDLAKRFQAIGGRVVIVSAQYGALAPEQQILPYERKMDHDRALELAENPPLYLSNFKSDERLTPYYPAPWFAYGGFLYRYVVCSWAKRLFGSDDCVIELVGANRGIGDHYAALRQLVEKVEGGTEPTVPADFAVRDAGSLGVRFEALTDRARDKAVELTAMLADPIFDRDFAPQAQRILQNEGYTFTEKLA